ncbi:MAG: hypothetical protein Ct9H300mP4_13990 [Gammaproteobacteria bacterium]|nr:MAG: hypothetical protein Ct9H300mP4_13990 [Gammaproteobacteria bacterium]
MNRRKFLYGTTPVCNPGARGLGGNKIFVSIDDSYPGGTLWCDIDS